MRMEYLKITLKSDLCAGNGESAGNAIDNDICVDDVGLPYIPARRIKGCLKQSAFDLEKMGYLPTASKEKRIALFGDAYGNEGCVFIRDAVIKDAGSIRKYLKNEIRQKENLVPDEIRKMAHASKIVDIFSSVRGQTKLQDGVKEDNSLRFTRVVGQYDPFSSESTERLTFYAPIYLNTEDTELRRLLESCCRATRHIGNSRNRGLGNVEVSLCSEGEVRKKEQICEADKKEIENDRNTDARVKISYQVVLNAPLTLPGCDEMNTSVPARSVIGCMAGNYLRCGNAKEDDFRKLFLDGTVSWSALTPVIAGEISVPVPMMLVKLKNDGNKMINHFIQENDDWKRKKPKTLDGSFAVKTQEGYQIAEPLLHTVYHHAINGTAQDEVTYTGSSKMLYMQDSIDAGAIYGGTVFCPASMKEKVMKCLKESRIQFGRSKSAQYASCSLVGEPKVEIDSPKYRSICAGEKIYVILQSDLALLKDGTYTTEAGNVRRAIAEKLGLSDKLPDDSQDYCRYHVIGGYQAMWQLQKPQIPVVRAGSVYCFEAQQGEVPQRIHLGEYAQEGMGLCSVMTTEDMKQSARIEMTGIDQAEYPHDKKRINQLLIRLQIEAVMENMREAALNYNTEGRDLPSARLRNMLVHAKNYQELYQMIDKVKESDKSSEKKTSRREYAKSFVCDMEKLWIEQLEKYPDVKKQIEMRWKEPLDLVLHKHHYQKDKRGEAR